MAVGIRKEWLMLGAGVALGVLLAWAWYDGGARPLRELSEPAVLPEPAP